VNTDSSRERQTEACKGRQGGSRRHQNAADRESSRQSEEDRGESRQREAESTQALFGGRHDQLLHDPLVNLQLHGPVDDCGEDDEDDCGDDDDDEDDDDDDDDDVDGNRDDGDRYNQGTYGSKRLPRVIVAEWVS
jgi:hypothetical protein